ncbi:MAG: ROK family protein [Cyclobacteriaceae bacterium]
MEILGIDIGGTGIKGAIVDTSKGELVTDRYRLETPQPATPEAVVETVNDLVEHFNWNGYIGSGFPAAMKHDVVKTASNITKEWIGLNAAQLIMAKTGCQAHLVNDVDAAGYAEIKHGAGKGNTGTIIVLAAGTGIGSAIFTEGILYPNTELGFVMVNDIYGEHYASNAVKERESLKWREWASRFNEYLLRVESLFWPDLFILGGGVSKKFEKFSEYFTTEAPVVPATMKNNAGIIGAAVAARHHFTK